MMGMGGFFGVYAKSCGGRQELGGGLGGRLVGGCWGIRWGVGVVC